MDRRQFLKFSSMFSLFGAGAALSPSAAAAIGAVHQSFPHPRRIRYDSLSFFVEDKPFYIYSGSFHYFRCPQPLWPERFAKIRDAGFNTLETYVPWNYHERRKPAGPGDYSHVHFDELEAWLAMAESHGLYTIIRMGPYVCGEWDTGGFPQWLLTYQPRHVRGMWLRSDDPVFVEWSRHWYHALCPVVARHQITRKAVGKPGVILAQVENEYSFAGVPVPAKERYVATLVELAHHHGIDVPLFTNLAGFVLNDARFQRMVFDTIDRYPGWAVDAMGRRMKRYRRGQPGAPVMAAETQGGYFTPVAGVPALHTQRDQYAHGLNGAQITALSLYSIAAGMTAMNYYMLFGGTNLGTWAGANVSTSYDYSAPIRECGGVGEKYRAVQAMGEMLRTHGPALARSRAVHAGGSTGSRAVHLAAREAPDGSLYLFFRSTNRSHGTSGTARVAVGGRRAMRVRYRLGPGGSNVFYLRRGHSAARGQWLLREVPPPPPAHGLPGPVEIGAVRYRADPLPTDWRTVQHGESLADLGVYDSGFSYYQLHVQPRRNAAGAALSVALAPQDSATALVHGKILHPVAPAGSPAIFRMPGHTSTEPVHAILAYENTGHWNTGIGMQDRFGIHDAGLMQDDAIKHVDGWKMRIARMPHRATDTPLVRANYPDADWQPAEDPTSRPLRKHQFAVYRATLAITHEELSRGNTLLCLEDVASRGWVFANGHLLGLAGGGAPWTTDARRFLHRGNNSIAVIVQCLGGRGGLGQVRLLPAMHGLGRMQGRMQFAAGPTGLGHGWHRPGFDDAHWHHARLGGSEVPPEALLLWARMEFHLPHVVETAWLPWCARLDAAGDALLYLNGKPIGRYWQHGGQREFFLPDNYLHHAGGKNVLAMCLRPIDAPAKVLAAVIKPYTVYAEHRG